MVHSTCDCYTQYSQGYIAGLNFALSLLENMQHAQVVNIPTAIAIIKDMQEQCKGAKIIAF